VIVEAMFLKPLDQITYPLNGVVSSVDALHHPCCDGKGCGGLCRGDPRVRVRLDNNDSEFIWSAMAEFEIHRPESEPEYRPDLLDEERL
jgi:hypothetical protein